MYWNILVWLRIKIPDGFWHQISENLKIDDLVTGGTINLQLTQQGATTQMTRTYTISILICDVLPEWTQGAVSRVVKETLRSSTLPREGNY